MEKSEVEQICNYWINKRKGFTVEIEDYVDTETNTTFSVRIQRNGYPKAIEAMHLFKQGHPEKVQLESKMQRFAALVENGRY